jgi:hypothetical protein
VAAGEGVGGVTVRLYITDCQPCVVNQPFVASIR